MNATECYFNGELSPEMKDSFYQSLLQDGKELLNVISTIGLMKKAADFSQEEVPPELDPPETGTDSMADELLELTLKALTEAGPDRNQIAATDVPVELQPPVMQQDLPGTLVQLIARLDETTTVMPPATSTASSPSGSCENA